MEFTYGQWKYLYTKYYKFFIVKDKYYRFLDWENSIWRESNTILSNNSCRFYIKLIYKE